VFTFRLRPPTPNFTPFAERPDWAYFTGMKTLLLHRVFTAAGLFGLLAGGAVAAPQAASNDKSPVQTTAAITPAAAGAPLQPVAPIGGAFPQAPIDPAQRLRYFGAPSPTVLGGWFGSAPAGGAFQAGPIGGTMLGQMPPGGRLTNLFGGGAFSAGFNPGGIMIAAHPPGGQLGSNILGGLRNPANASLSGPGSLILGGAQPAGASPGGLLVPEASLGGVIVPGTALGGVIVGGAPLITNAPGGRLTNAPGGQLH
jgi:hypothetical protein